MSTPKSASKRLLVVDDEAAIRKFVRNVAEPLGWTVLEAANGEMMVNLFNSFMPDLVLLDIVMPEMDGVEVVQWLGEHNCLARIVTMTGYDPSYTQGAAAIGEVYGIKIFRALKKPIPVAELRAILEAE